MVEVELVDVRIEESTKQPFMELRPKDGTRRILPIFIGLAEAGAIKAAIENKHSHRPMTHDLFIATLTATGSRLDQVVINDYQKRVFFAELHLVVDHEGQPGGRRETVSARPSDAVALAVRCGASIFVNDSVLDECALPDLAPAEPADNGELVDEFRKFIDDINPEDFR